MQALWGHISKHTLHQAEAWLQGLRFASEIVGLRDWVLGNQSPGAVDMSYQLDTLTFLPLEAGPLFGLCM